MPPASVDSRKVQSEDFAHTGIKNRNSSIERISIIIPVLNEVGTIKEALASTYPSTNVEAIAVDGGSTDGTVGLVQSLGVKVLSAPAGRACQMNAGAMAATGEILLFLHADTRLPPGFDTMVRAALQLSMPGDRKAPIAGAFALQIDAALRRLRLIEWGVNWRSHFLQMPYGDQAIFLKAKTFYQMGGFPELPIMEDFELMRRLKRTGRIALIPTPVVTSARRWLKKGVCQTTLINQIVILAYLLNVSPKQLVHWYRHQPKLTPNHWFRSTPNPKSASITPLSTEAGEEIRSSQREIVHPDWV
ncbi:MAG TPA: glycosyltransferase [Cyanobacteria bacterium UBA8553]|nr:glycosyltransferase [Cyanobacteria bacterium UBA8553]